VSVRVVVIGTGWWSTQAHLPALEADREAEIVALADSDPDNLARAAERFDVRRTFEDAQTMLAAVELRAGDIIAAVNGTPVDYGHPLDLQLLRFQPGDEVTVSVLRDIDVLELAITLGTRPTDIGD
jgi:PDZ domain-containing secreted protein